MNTRRLRHLALVSVAILVLSQSYFGIENKNRALSVSRSQNELAWLPFVPADEELTAMTPALPTILIRPSNYLIKKDGERVLADRVYSGYGNGLVFIIESYKPKADDPSTKPPGVSPLAQRQPLQLPLSQPKIVVKKGQRQLLLFSGEKLLRTYRVGLGLSPIGDKVRSGDYRTPEGDFYIFTKNDKSAYYLSLGISYPNAPAAERGLRDHLINKSQYDAIMRALRARKGPPRNTLLGGDIYIHGNGAQSDWTWGCVALENEDIRELFNAVSAGTPVKIEP